MHNAWTVGLRSACSRLLFARWTIESLSLRAATPGLREATLPLQRYIHDIPLSRKSPQLPLDRRKAHEARSRSFSSSASQKFQQSTILQKLKPYKKDKPERGLSFRSGDLTQQELVAIFGRQIPPATFANRLLRILHGRRVDGTLDIDPPEEVKHQLQKYPYAVADGLVWLRKYYPIDEDAAILRRIEREEAATIKDNPAELMQRAEDLGLYKPQSGKFGAELGDKGDVYGKSEFDRIRAENIAKLEKEEQELDEQIQQITKDAKEKVGGLQVRDEQGLEVSDGIRPPNTFEKWVLKNKKAAQSKLSVESAEIASKSFFRRIFPSAILVSLTLLISYLGAQYWVPPARADRLWPNMSLSYATLLGIFAINLGIFSLWRTFPPAWGLLNRYFLSVAATPRPFSMLGSSFSHQQLSHLAINMAILLLFPLPAALHEQVGRGTFVAIYLASGAMGSFASLVNLAARRSFTTTSLGASGAVLGIIAAYCAVQSDRNFTFFFIPTNWQETVQVKGWMLLAAMGGWEVLGALFRVRLLVLGGGAVDHIGHLGGFVTGAVAGWWWRTGREAERKKRRLGMRKLSDQSPEELLWFEKIFGKRPSS